MNIETLHLNNFRNHHNITLSFENKNIIVGKNGSGKTSIVEAIFTVLTGRSFRTNNLKNLINYSSDFFKLVGVLVDKNYKSRFKLFYKNIKEFYLDDKKVDKPSDFILKHPVVCYSPENEGLLSNEMEFRRRFLDRTIGYIYPEHLYNLKSYLKLLNLKKNHIYNNISDPLIYESIHEKMVYYSEKITEKRDSFINKFNEYIEKNLSRFPSFTSEKFLLFYHKDTIKTDIIDKELKEGKILSGPQRDRVNFILNGYKLERIASFGQKKSLALFSIYCFIKIVEEFLKSDIIVILDDFEAGLDMERINFFLEKINSSQLFITGLNEKNFNGFNIIKI